MNWNRALTAGEVRCMVGALVVFSAAMTSEALHYVRLADLTYSLYDALLSLDNAAAMLIQVCTQ